MSALRKAAEARLAELRAEAAKGEQALAELDARRAELGRMMLRIAGAVQVLEETLAAADASSAEDDWTAGGSSADHGSMAAGSVSDGDSPVGGSSSREAIALASAAA